jgi:hypothetical protein
MKVIIDLTYRFFSHTQISRLDAGKGPEKPGKIAESCGQFSKTDPDPAAALFYWVPGSDPGGVRKAELPEMALQTRKKPILRALLPIPKRKANLPLPKRKRDPNISRKGQDLHRRRRGRRDAALQRQRFSARTEYGHPSVQTSAESDVGRGANRGPPIPERESRRRDSLDAVGDRKLGQDFFEGAAVEDDERGQVDGFVEENGEKI